MSCTRWRWRCSSPRATAPGSPFRFLVLDDPIQAMDPAKVEGFVRVLERIAATRQVIVFSHDDRLATAIRNLAVDARIVEITRCAGSTITVTESTTPALQYIKDADAVLLDDNVPDAVKSRVVPGIVRLAVEAAARDAYFARSYAAGRAVLDAEKQWEDARTTRQKLALAVLDDGTERISGWLSYRAHRRPVFAVCDRGAHQGAVVDKDLLRDLRAMVDELEKLS